MGESVLSAIAREIGKDAIVQEPEALERHAQDWSGYGNAMPAAVLMPRTPSEVAAILKRCNEARQPVVIQGGLTGLCGAASAQEGELALSLERLTGLEVREGALVAEAGVTVERAQAAAHEEGLSLGIDFGARGSAMIGGALATNAGGLRVIESGMARAHVLGLEVALADGRLLSELTPMVKVNAGFDIKHLFIGTEGTLGVITRACLALSPSREGLATAAVALSQASGALAMLRLARRALGPDLSAFEAMWPGYVSTMSERTPFSVPVAGALTLIVEARAASHESAAAAMEAALAEGVEAGLVEDAVIAQSQAQARALWQLRDEGVALYNQIFADIVSFDVSVPPSRLLDAAEAIAAPYTADDLFPLLYGHIGDQNLHFVLGADRPLSETEHKEVAAHVYRTVCERGGSVSAEHGIGILKKPYLTMSRSPVAIELMRTLKATLDPNGILNPGRVFDMT